MNDVLSHVKIRSKEEVDRWLKTESTKFTLSQIHTLTCVASMVDVKGSKYKTTAIFHLQGSLRVLFDDGDLYCYNLLTMADPEEALALLKKDVAEALEKKGLKVDNRTMNTVYLSGSHKETSVPLPEPFSGPRSLQNRKNRMTTDTETKEKPAAVDRHRELNKDGSKFSTKATHEGYKLYAVKPSVRQEGKEGYDGMAAIVAEQGIMFEEWVKANHGNNHLNWDINREAIVTVPKDEEFDLAAAVANLAVKATKAPKTEAASGEAPAEPAGEDDDAGDDE